MTDKKKLPESSEGKGTGKTSTTKEIHQQLSHFGVGNIVGRDKLVIAKNNPTVTRSKLPEPTETPPTPIVAKPKK